MSMNHRTMFRSPSPVDAARAWLRWALDRPLRLIPVAVLVILTGGVWVLQSGGSDAVAIVTAEQANVLELLEQDVAKVEVRALSRRIPLTGNVEPRDWTEVKAQVTGEIAQVMVRPGETVKRGQVLARLDARELRARMADRKASLSGARAQLALAEKKRDAMRAMFERGVVSQMELDTALSTYDVNAASVASLQAQLDQASKALGDTEIHSPLDGVVSERVAQVGSVVTSGAKLFTVVDLATLELEALVPATDIPDVRVGQEVTFQVEGFGERAFMGVVERINPSTQPGSRSIAIYVYIENAQGDLKGGMFAQGSLQIAKSADAKVIPAAALREEGGKSFVYRITGDKLVRQDVEVGIRDTAAGVVEIGWGLEAGDRVITSALVNLQPGTTVRIASLDAPTPKP